MAERHPRSTEKIKKCNESAMASRKKPETPGVQGFQAQL